MRMFEGAANLMSHPSASQGATRMTSGNRVGNVVAGIAASPRSFKKGGKVKKTGLAKVHKGETVVPVKKKKSGKRTKPKTQKVNLGKKGSFKVKRGALHKALGVPSSEKLGQTRIDAALKSKNPRIRRMAASAKGLTAMKHGS